MASTGHVGYVTIGVSPALRDTLRERRDENGFNSYETLVRAMLEDFDPDEPGD